MNNKKSTKRALLSSVLSLVLCVAMLIGTTFAWFTDSVTSGNNKIVAGNLKVDLEVLEEDNTTWTSIKENPQPIFNYEYWEPGYTEVKILKVVNKGTLALKWKAMLTSENVLSDLANVIDVYVKEDVTAYSTERAVLDGWTKVGTLANFVGTLETTTVGKLSKGESETLGLAFKMQESAGNVYQGMDLGGAFDICITATQLTAEEDSFDDQYDKDADFDGEISNATSLTAALKNGGTYQVTSNINVDSAVTVPAGVTVALDLNGKTITGNVAKSVGHVFVNDGTLTLKGGTIASVAENGGSAVKNNGTLTIDGTTLSGAPQAGESWPSYAVNNYGDMVLKNATINSIHGAVACYNGGSTVVENCDIIVNGCGGSSHVFYIDNANTNVVVKGGTYTHKGNADGSLAYVANGIFTVDGGTFSASNGGYGMATTGGQIIVNGGTVNNQFMGWGGKITINGGTFKADPSKWVADGYKVIKNADGTWTVTDAIIVTPDTLLSTMDWESDTKYSFTGTFDSVSFTIPAGLNNVVLDGTNANFRGHVKATFNRIADGYNYVTETRKGSYVLQNFKVNDSLSIGACSVESLTVSGCKVEMMDFNASNTAVTLAKNEIVRVDTDAYTRYDGRNNNNAVYFYADNYDLKMTGNVVTDTVGSKNLVVIQGNYEQYQAGKDITWSNTVSMTDNTLTCINDSVVKIYNDVTYAPVAWPEDYEITSAAQTLAAQLFKDNTVNNEENAVIEILCRATGKTDLEATELNNDILKNIAAKNN